ncbi:hypothetical protein FNF27_07947 [Cafeteria roenbergensis]|uniref:peptidylprolyl isomerase n=1 Tax=Cafeteria roenbergensis TaxID=33653 RepID=A0A5A8DCX1_CAFRO|nr:hypothetical protein FNF27_07947 [Cafeteria roenbergensis]
MGVPLTRSEHVRWAVEGSAAMASAGAGAGPDDYLYGVASHARAQAMATRAAAERARATFGSPEDSSAVTLASPAAADGPPASAQAAPAKPLPSPVGSVPSAPEAERGIRLHTWFTVQVTFESGRVRRTAKRYRDVTGVRRALKRLYPGVRLQPAGGLLAPHLMRDRTSARTVELRRAAAEAFLREAVRGASGMGSLILVFLFPGDTTAQLTVTAPPSSATTSLVVDLTLRPPTSLASLGLHAALAAATDPSDLPVQSQARGAPDGAPPGDASPGSDAGSDLLAFPGGSMPPGCCQLGRVVVIDDLDAFDDLTERGFALLDMAALTRRQARRLLAPPGGARRPPEEGSAAAPPRGGGEDHVSEGATGRGGGQGASPEAAAAGAGVQHPVLPLPGERLRLAFTVSVWDGGSLAAADVQRVRRAAVTLPFPEQAEAAAGALPEGLRALPGEPEAQDDIDAAAAAARHGMELYRALPLPLGLYPALSMLPYGHGARVVLAPEAAFGEVALPPLIPAEAYLVYDVSLAPAQPELLQRRREQGTLRQSAADVARARVGRATGGGQRVAGRGGLAGRLGGRLARRCRS